MKEETVRIILVAIVVIIALTAKVLMPIIKGKYGEAKISLILKLLRSDKYKILNNVLIMTKYRNSQIDHIIVSNYGVFVIETKNYKGWIFGDERSNEWTQTLFKNKYKFRNPIIQTWGHINTLKKVLEDFGSIHYYPIIVFTGNAKLKGITSNVPVIYSIDLLAYIKNNSITECLSNKEVEIIHNKIIHLNRKDRTSRKLHVRKAKSISRMHIDIKTCPRCGGKLTLKNGKYGEFYGCLNFPRCKYTKNHQN